MNKLAHKMRSPRTGQVSVRGSNGGNGPCGPVPMAKAMSWGAACPTGNCTAENLANSLNRQFAGERYPCRELPYTLQLTADAGGDVTFEQNSRVTICPTRVIVAPEDGELLATGLLTVFEVGNQNQVIGDPIPLVQLAPDAYQAIPFVTDCIKAGIPFSVQMTDLGAGQVVYFTIIGPAIG